MKPERWYSSFAKPTRVPTASTKPMTKKAKKIGSVRSFIESLLVRGETPAGGGPGGAACRGYATRKGPVNGRGRIAA